MSSKPAITVFNFSVSDFGVQYYIDYAVKVKDW